MQEKRVKKRKIEYGGILAEIFKEVGTGEANFQLTKYEGSS